VAREERVEHRGPAPVALAAGGAEENALLASAQRNNARRRLETVRANTAHLTAQGSAAAEAALRARGEPFYRVSRSGVAYLLG
jgi:hypothetical protein